MKKKQKSKAEKTARRLLTKIIERNSLRLSLPEFLEVALTDKECEAIARNFPYTIKEIRQIFPKIETLYKMKGIIMLNKGLFSSASGKWTTPPELYRELNNEFHFDFDPCPVNPTFDGLNISWGKSSYVNPPYGREIYKRCKKAFEEWQKGKTIVMLIPSRTDTRWWHDFIMKADEIRFIKGRLKFSGHENSAPFPSAIVIWRSRLREET